ncbi:MAG: hypothetical protein WBA48_03275 [Xanthobacteraceae bacterium]
MNVPDPQIAGFSVLGWGMKLPEFGAGEIVILSRRKWAMASFLYFSSGGR